MKPLNFVWILLLFGCLHEVVKARTVQELPHDPLKPYVNSKPIDYKLISNQEDSVALKRFTFLSRGGTNTIYGTMCSPTQAGRYPALLMFHGGGSCADENVRLQRVFAAKGYVVMAIDLPGICDPVKASFSKGAWRNRPKGIDSRLDISKGLDSSTLVDAIAAGLQAFNLLAAQENVNKQVIGITGFSWGGYMTTIISGLLGNRVKAAYSVFGCGFYDRGSLWKAQLESMPEKQRANWLTYFDAGRRASNIKCPYFIEATVNDKFFWPEAVAATLDAIKSETNLIWTPNLDHRRPPGAEHMQLLYFNYHFKLLGQPFGRVTIKRTKAIAGGGKELTVNVAMPKSVSVESIALYYAEKSATRATKKWTALPLQKTTGNTYKINIPGEVLAQGVDYYVYAVDSRKVSVSTSIEI